MCLRTRTPLSSCASFLLRARVLVWSLLFPARRTRLTSPRMICSFANFECNATAPMKITQHFAKLMVDKKLKGLIAFTSSSAGECLATVRRASRTALETREQSDLCGLHLATTRCRICAKPAVLVVRIDQVVLDAVCNVGCS